MENNEIKKRLSSINWNFDFTIDYGGDVLHPFNCRRYYSYPATFIPEIPYAMIEILSQKGDVVLDPFGGIGTTFIQALSLEREPVSFDINPIATNVCDTLYKLFDPSKNKNEIREQLLQLCEGYDSSKNYTTYISRQQKELRPWFEENTFNELSFLFEQFNKLKETVVHDVMKLILSSILVVLSSQNKGWAYIADNVKPKQEELKKKCVFEHYKTSVKNLLNDVVLHVTKLPDSFPNFYSKISKDRRVFNDSLTDVDYKSETVDLIITSPPYPKMIDYVKSQRLSFNFTNIDFAHYIDKEIGARCRRSRRDCLPGYENDIKKINKKISDVLKKGGYFCVVLPDYDTKDDRKEIINKIVEDYTNLGMNKIFEVNRYIPSHRRTLSIQWATLVNERIYVFQKG